MFVAINRMSRTSCYGASPWQRRLRRPPLAAPAKVRRLPNSAQSAQVGPAPAAVVGRRAMFDERWFAAVLRLEDIAAAAAGQRPSDLPALYHYKGRCWIIAVRMVGIRIGCLAGSSEQLRSRETDHRRRVDRLIGTFISTICVGEQDLLQSKDRSLPICSGRQPERRCCRGTARQYVERFWVGVLSRSSKPRLPRPTHPVAGTRPCSVCSTPRSTHA